MRTRFFPVFLLAVLAACDGGTEASPPAALVVVSGGSQTGILGQALPAPVTVRVSDVKGKSVRGATVTWAASNGTLSAASSVTDTAGRASVTWTLATNVANQSLTVAVGGVAPVIVSAHGRPALPAVIHSCETNTATLCADWHLVNGQYTADWSQGSHAVIVPTAFELDSVVFTRDDPSGTSAGMHAVYKAPAQVNNTITHGLVTWTPPGSFSFNGVWDASW